MTDNGSEDPACHNYLDDLGNDSDVSVERLESNQGPAAGKNAGVRSAIDRFDIIAVLDNDIEVLPGWDEAAIEGISSGYAVVVPKLLDGDRKTVSRGPTRPWNEPWLLHPEYLGVGEDRNSPLVNSGVEISTFPGTAIISRYLFEKVGLYDERLWAGEDYELAIRASRERLKFHYSPTCELVHDHGFNLKYENKRRDPARLLWSHAVIWRRHRKALLPPSAIRHLLQMARKKEDCFNGPDPGVTGLLRKVRRRLEAKYYSIYGEVWRSPEYADRETERMLQKLEQLTAVGFDDYGRDSLPAINENSV